MFKVKNFFQHCAWDRKCFSMRLYKGPPIWRVVHRAVARRGPGGFSTCVAKIDRFKVLSMPKLLLDRAVFSGIPRPFFWSLIYGSKPHPAETEDLPYLYDPRLMVGTGFGPAAKNLSCILISVTISASFELKQDILMQLTWREIIHLGILIPWTSWC